MSKPLVLLSNEEIHEIVGKIIASPDFSTDGYTMMKVAPFASMSDVDKMLSAADEKGISFGGLYPLPPRKRWLPQPYPLIKEKTMALSRSPFRS